MPSWKKVIISGSDAALNSLNVTTSLTASGIIYPTVDGTDNQVIKTDGNGNLFFDNVVTTTISIKNVSGGTIVKGTPCYITGSGTSGNVAGVWPADASNPLKMPAGVIAGETLNNGDEGIGLLNGFINGVNTSAFAAGDSVYVAVGGGYTNVRPTGSSVLIQKLGNVEKVDASNGSGVINGPGYYNEVPNIQQGYTWVGNSDGVATPIATSSIQNVISSSYALTASHTTAIVGTDNYVPKFNGTSALENSLIYDDGTNIGIGTDNPTTKLQISSTMSTSPTSNIFLDVDGTNNTGGGGSIFFSTSATAGTTELYNANISGVRSSAGDGSSDLLFATTNVSTSTTPATRLIIKDTGNVGIGTDNPGAKLDVIGDISGSTTLTIGSSHTNSGTLSSIAGGTSNTNSGNCSFIGGGRSNNIASSVNTSVIAGGFTNTICSNHLFASILGGRDNTVDTDYGVIGGGYLNGNFGSYSIIGGGCANTVCSGEQFGAILGGRSNQVDGDYSVVTGGYLNCARGNCNFIGGGYSNDTTAFLSTIGGGCDNCAYNSYAAILGGVDNYVVGCYGVVVGGYLNCTTGGCSFTGGGCLNSTLGNFSVIAGGTSNTNSGACSFIGGGARNYINTSAVSSSIVGGFDNTTNLSNTHIIGSGITADKANYTFVNNLDVETDIIGSTISLTGLANQASEATAVMINGSNVVGTRELGTNAFNSTAFTTCTGTVTGTGTTNYLPKFTGTSALGNSLVYDNGTNVGIGTSNPSALLHIGTNNTTTDALIRLSVAYSSDRTSRGGITWNDSSNVTGKIYTEYDGTTVSMVFGSLYSSGYNTNQLMIIRGNGNVGIGTSSPDQKLVISGSNNVYSKIVTSAADSTLGINLVNDARSWVVRVDGADGDKFQIRDASADAQRVTIDTSGNVGIGITAPVSKLHVYQNDTLINQDAGITIEQDGTGDAILQYLQTGLYRWVTGIDNSDGDKFKIGRGISWGTGQDFTIDTSGNVGIGTTSPSYKLDVNGTGRATTDFRAPIFYDTDNTGYYANPAGTSRLLVVQTANGTAGAPAYSFVTDTNTGMYIITTDTIGFSTAGSERLRITSAGAMGLGGITPTNTTGRFEASNDIVAYSSSDKNWKKNIKNINSPLEKISQINGVEFDWIEDEPIHGNKGHDIGVIAQEIEQILPEAVQTRQSGMKAVQYDKIIPLLIEAIKELQKEVKELKNKI